MSKKDKTIKITLEFDENDLNSMLRSATFGDAKPLTVNKVIKAGRWAQLKKELTISADTFVMEIVDGSDAACANDWLSAFSSDE